MAAGAARATVPWVVKGDSVMMSPSPRWPLISGLTLPMPHSKGSAVLVDANLQKSAWGCLLSTVPISMACRLKQKEDDASQQVQSGSSVDGAGGKFFFLDTAGELAIHRQEKCAVKELPTHRSL